MGEPKKIIYRVTAMGFGPREGTQVVLQTVFRKE
jgi:Tfp pilus assembly protein PilX